MAHTRANRVARSSSAAHPISQSVSLEATDTVVCVLLNVIGTSVRGGGSPSLNGVPMRQANSTQRGAASPEASAEVWYLDQRDALPWPAASYTLSIPNQGLLTIKYTVEAGQAAGGAKSALDGANGGNNTSTNPTPGAVAVTQSGDIGWAIIAGGAQTWAPSAQVGTAIANTDDGSTGGGEQYILNPAVGNHTLSWTFGTSEDWGAVSVYFKEVLPQAFNGYMGMDAGNGISCTEKIR